MQQAFSRDGESKTIVARDTLVQSWMGQREGPSFLDIKLANEAYQCDREYFICVYYPACNIYVTTQTAKKKLQKDRVFPTEHSFWVHKGQNMMFV